jgi:thiol-disulfide isomerase/thioredoxin
MKKLLSILSLLLSGYFIQIIQAQGIEFFHGTYAEAVAKAQKENKLVFMDAYAEWCGPCKKMAATTFKDEKVGKFFNDNFVNVKMDMEKGEGPGLQRKFDVTAYPTLLFINGKGELVHKGVGGQGNEQLIALGRTASGKVDNSKEFEKAYNEGKRDPELIINYVRALNRAGKPSLKIVNDYLQKADMADANTLKIIFEGTTQADSKVFDLLIKNKAAIIPLFTERQVKEKIQDACEKTLSNAIEYKNPELYKEAKDKMKAHVPEKAELFAIDADLKFFKASGNAKDYCKTCETILKKEGKNDARMLFATAKQMIDAFPYDKTALGDAEKYFKKAAENGGFSEYYYWYAHTLMRNGKKKDALTAAEKALQIAKETAPNYVPATEQLIDQIKQKS